MWGGGTRLGWLLVLALACWSLALGGEEEEDGEVVVGKEEEEVLSDELKEEDDVLVLHQNNFARALKEHQLLLVEFYAPWCGHCQRLAPAFAQAATMLRNESIPVRLAKVDATAQVALAKEFNITSYPTLKLFRHGNRTHPLAYTGRMDTEGIVRWTQRRAGPSAALLQDTNTTAAFISSQDLVVVGFFKDLESEAAQAFYEVAGEMVDMPFGVVEAAELFKEYGLSADTVCLFKKTSNQIFSAKIPHHMLLFLNKSSPAQQELRDGFQAAASTFRGKVLFVVVDVSGHGAEVLSFFGMTPADTPTLRMVRMENNRKYRMDQDSFTARDIQSFIRAVLDGKVKPHLLSAEPPEDWDRRPVKVLVGKTFEQVAFDETKNVFVKFYAPWCSHCQAMAAAWEELGERYRDHGDIIIAEMDSTANELENITISGFPTLHYFPAGPGRKVVEYKSARDVETFSKFLENGGMLPEEPPVVTKTPENSTGSEELSLLGTPETREEL
ncbi:protein disulfide-isomerase A2 isoform X2 [Heliangelus exortis]|uniref:protein disulfide-isomerase A2 isoform X2 n=1 Tax=Heliangelus exortis TaxID=472823 RepID=UPI003A8EAE4A